jgi:amino acid permease
MQTVYLFYSSIYFGLVLYWLPFLICLFGYSHKTFVNYQKDLKDRNEAKYYSPTDTVGAVIGRLIVSICPVINLWCAMFDVSPKLLANFITHLEIIFNTPLVPKKLQETSND